MIDDCPSFEGGDCVKKSKMALSKKTSQATKKLGADFGAALVKARRDTDHIFKQASEDEGFSNSNSAHEMSLHSTESNSGRTNPRCKAAAWAWHQRGGGGSSGGSPENVRNRALVVVRRSSRFKAEALRINASYTAEDTVIKAEHKWDPNQSLFDSYELLSVARELDKALNQHVASSSSSSSSPSSMKKSRSSNSNGSSSSSSIQSGGVDSAKPMGRLLRLLPAPVLCLSEDDVATTKSTSFKKKHENNRKNPSVGSSPSSGGAFEKISKAIQLLRYSPPADSNEDAEEHLHHHEHFHHHHHHHHHHVDVLRRS